MAPIEREISPSPRGGARARPCNAEQSFVASRRSLPDWKSSILSVSHNLHTKISGFPFSRNLDSNLSWLRSFQDCLFLSGLSIEAVIHFHIPFLISVSNGSNHTSRNTGFFHFKLFMCFRMRLVCNSTQKIWLFLFFLPFVITTRTQTLQKQFKQYLGEGTFFFFSFLLATNATLSHYFCQKKNDAATVTSNHFEKYHLSSFSVQSWVYWSSRNRNHYDKIVLTPVNILIWHWDQ